MTAQRILLIISSMAVWACAGSSASPVASPASPPAASTTVTAAPSSAAIVLHETPGDLGCDAIGIDYTSMTFHVDPTAAEQVSATTDTNVSLVTYWPVGFNAGERVVRDTAGAVVITDGDVLKSGELLHGYYVCLAPKSIYVMLAKPTG